MSKTPEDIASIERRIARMRQKQKRKNPPSAIGNFLKNAMRVATEFVAPIFIGISIGYVLDKCFDTRIVFMLIMAIFGLAAGMLNVYRAAQQIERDMDGSN